MYFSHRVLNLSCFVREEERNTLYVWRLAAIPRGMFLIKLEAESR